MQVKIKKVLISLVSLVVLFFLIMNWFYPYSSFSIYRSYNYTPDPIVVDQYLDDLNEFQSRFEEDLEQELSKEGEIVDYTIDRTQYVLQLFEQEWLESKEPIKLNKKEFEHMLFEVKHARDVLLSLAARDGYTREQREYLIDSLESILVLEESILNIKTGKAESRGTLNRQIHNLHGDIISSLMMYEIFYDAVKKE